MTDINKVKDIISSLYDEAGEMVFKVYDIFKEFFGEEYVDLQGISSKEDFIKKSLDDPSFPTLRDTYANKSEGYKSVIDGVKFFNFSNAFILVHFPLVRVTNEYDKYIDIKDLYVKQRIDSDGSMQGYFKMIRATYNVTQFKSGYIHSHCPAFYPRNFNSADFSCVCTGTGPINNTIATLSAEYDYDLWNLFCLELSKYVTVESVSGVPYIRLETVGENSNSKKYSEFKATNTCFYNSRSRRMYSFIKYIINNKVLKFNYYNNSYSLGMSFLEYMILISNTYIEWNNKLNKTPITDENDAQRVPFDELLEEHVIGKGVLRDKYIIYVGDENRDYNISSFEGNKVCDFKGKTIHLHIEDIEPTNDNYSIFLNYQDSMFIITQLLKILNYRYGRKEETDKPHRKVCYL